MKLAATPTSPNTATTTTGTSKTSHTPSTSNSNDDDWVDVTDKSDDVASKVFTFAPSKGLGVLPSANTDTELAAVENFLSDDIVDSIIEIINSYVRTQVQMNMPFLKKVHVC